MFLSRLMLNPLSRTVGRDLRDPYQMHRTIMSGFSANLDKKGERILFRIDSIKGQSMLSLMVQSWGKPNWPSSIIESGYVLHRPQIKKYDPELQDGLIFRYRLRANPTIKRDGRRLGLYSEEEQLEWLKRKSELNGFELLSTITIPEGKVKAAKKDHNENSELTFVAVRFDGMLKVIDPFKFGQALRQGIGPAKGLGFGLLSLARRS